MFEKKYCQKNLKSKIFHRAKKKKKKKFYWPIKYFVYLSYIIKNLIAA